MIGASTGGPQALNAIVAQLGSVLDRAPVLITQHMPPTFTAILAEHLGRLANRPVREARDGEAVNAGTVYLAPGGRHMSVARRDGTAVIALDDGPLINFCKPAVDPLFASAAASLGSMGGRPGADRHGLGRPARRAGDRRRRRLHPGAGRGRPAWSGACRARWPMPASARPCCRSPRSRQNSRASSRGTRRDPAGFRLSAPDAAPALRPGAVGRKAISRRKPPAAGGAQARVRKPHRTGGQAESLAGRGAARRRGGRGDDHQ